MMGTVIGRYVDTQGNVEERVREFPTLDEATISVVNLLREAIGYGWMVQQFSSPVNGQLAARIDCPDESWCEVCVLPGGVEDNGLIEQ